MEKKVIGSFEGSNYRVELSEFLNGEYEVTIKDKRSTDESGWENLDKGIAVAMFAQLCIDFAS